ncbi:lytic transglycosylase domain-containing protein [Bacteriovorax sp. Seq25_V]|uniref:lytic transglycosylase domain-containing protein n=1 Tax=Bacteriovorax sp. Seq25_V TaxID=1201288 RepID=UPI00038A15D5|nr:lytic transglycosylase domain-containing protein [Bacteriovorax sp. Seq25_V]EQC44693.1 transglycosylase SLT domain protein [Bacteriovorax sp. Seq25_V]
MLRKCSKFVAAALIFSSCSMLNTNESANTEVSNAAPADSSTTETTPPASSSQIIGSSLIDEPYHYDGKTYFLYGAEHLKLENYYFDIPVVYNDAVKKWISYFLNRGRGFFERYSARAGRYAPLMSRILAENGLPKDLIFLAMAESGFQSKAKSWAKAVGPWQFMPYTGKRYGLKIDWYTDERRDPIKSSQAAAMYLKKLYGDFESWELAAAAYNAGEGKMGRAIKRYGTENFWKLRNGRYLKPETKNYVPKIMALAIIGKNLKAFGFDDIEFHEPLDYEEIVVDGGTDLFKVAELLEVEFDELHYLNPELLRWFTPPTQEKYSLRIPVGLKAKWDSCCQYANYFASDFQKYRVKSSRSDLRDVARKFKIKDVEVLTWLNDGLSKNSRLKSGQEVVLPFRNGQSVRAEMYADLYDMPRKSVLRKRNYRSRIKLARARAKPISNPSRYYTVQKGDSLWTVARKNGISLDKLIVSNLDIVKNRMIRAGDKLVVD